MNYPETTSQKMSLKVWRKPTINVIEVKMADIIATSASASLNKMEEGDWMEEE